MGGHLLSITSIIHHLVIILKVNVAFKLMCVLYFTTSAGTVTPSELVKNAMAQLTMTTIEGFRFEVLSGYKVTPVSLLNLSTVHHTPSELSEDSNSSAPCDTASVESAVPATKV